MISKLSILYSWYVTSLQNLTTPWLPDHCFLYAFGLVALGWA